MRFVVTEQAGDRLRAVTIRSIWSYYIDDLYPFLRLRKTLHPTSNELKVNVRMAVSVGQDG